MKTFVQSFKDYYYGDYFFEHMMLLVLGTAALLLTIATVLSRKGSLPEMINLYEGIQQAIYVTVHS